MKNFISKNKIWLIIYLISIIGILPILEWQGTFNFDGFQENVTLNRLKFYGIFSLNYIILWLLVSATQESFQNSPWQARTKGAVFGLIFSILTLILIFLSEKFPDGNDFGVIKFFHLIFLGSHGIFVPIAFVYEKIFELNWGVFLLLPVLNPIYGYSIGRLYEKLSRSTVSGKQFLTLFFILHLLISAVLATVYIFSHIPLS